MITEHPEAAQTLSQSGDELKRQLQQNGTALLRLDIESSGQQRSGQQDQTGSAPDSTGSGSGAGSSDEDATMRTAPSPRHPPSDPCGLRARERARLRRAPQTQGPLT